MQTKAEFHAFPRFKPFACFIHLTILHYLIKALMKYIHKYACQSIVVSKGTSLACCHYGQWEHVLFFAILQKCHCGHVTDSTNQDAKIMALKSQRYDWLLIRYCARTPYCTNGTWK